MFPKTDPTSTDSWQALTEHYKEMKCEHMEDMFAMDHQRFNKFSLGITDILFDYSKNIISEKTIALLLQLANDCQLDVAIKNMYNGDKINETEDRAVLHTALRNFSGNNVIVDGKNIMPGIHAVLAQIKDCCTKVHSGTWKGYTGKNIKYIVNIGIGGSHLGPEMVTTALKHYWIQGIETYFVSNVDGTDITETLKKINPEETLFLIASKTFTTQETMTNAHTARKWFLQHAKEESHIAQQFIALSTNKDEVIKFGILPENMFIFWDWVGGRYSLWSAIGLSIALTIGYDQFEQLLKGAYEVDNHFKTAPFEKNIPVIMGLLSIWYGNFFGCTSEAVLPYDQYLQHFPAYLQQLNMESNGKYVDRNGKKVGYTTGPIIWGMTGTNGQHAFYQLLHQGTQIIPCDFIAPAISHNPVDDHHEKLMSNFFAQTEAFMNGTATRMNAVKDNPYKVFEGNRPSNSFLIKEITAFNLGELIALYEHKIFVQGVIWNIYSFDQWGVELGKVLAHKILPELENTTPVTTHDCSTNGLINAYKQMKV